MGFDHERYQIPAGMSPFEQWLARRMLDTEAKVERLIHEVARLTNEVERLKSKEPLERAVGE